MNGQTVTVNSMEYPLTSTSHDVEIEGDIGEALNISFSPKNEFYKPGDILYNIAADVLIKVINVSYVPIAKVVNYGYKITESNSHPLERVVYTEDAVGKVKGSADWDIERIFSEIKPCLFKNGVVVGYLDPNNFEQFEDGTPADITSGEAGDVMIEFPKVAYKMSSVDDIVSASVTNNPDAKSVDPAYTFNAFSRITEGDRDRCYIGAYCGWVDANGKLRSLSGKYPAVNVSLDKFRLYASNNGDGYQQMGFYQLTLLQHLYLIRFGSTDSQNALGQGYVGQGSTTTITSGARNKQGMTYGTQEDKNAVKLFGIENIYGNVFTCIDGLCFNTQLRLMTSFKDFNDDGIGYTDNGAFTRVSSGTVSKVQGGTNTGFIIKTGVGAGYYYDNANLSEGYLPRHGGEYRVRGTAGMFALSFGFPPGGVVGTSLGARLCFV